MKEVMNMNTETKFLVIDTETTNSIDDPFCYDIGFAVVDATGKTYETHSYVVADIFLDNELMASAYFADKIPQYWEDIKSGKRILRRFKTIKSILRDVVTQYGIRYVVAHNASFDYRSLNYTQRLLTSSKYRYFLPWGVEIWDTLKMARQVLGKDEVSRGKPDPEGIFLLSEQLGVALDDIIYVGDSYTDQQAASAAGVDFGAVCTGAVSAENFAKNKTAGIYPDFGALCRDLCCELDK